MKYKSFVCLAMLFGLISCNESKHQQIVRITKEWSGKEILFPDKIEFSLYGKEHVCDTISKSEYKIVTYIDSLGCASCKLRLSSWKTFIQQLDTLNLDVPILFFLHPFDSRSLKAILRRDSFNYPVCMDQEDILNKKNYFPADLNFQTFLLDRNNKVVAIGNPVYKPKVKELYLNILAPDKQASLTKETKISVHSSMIDFGKFKQMKRDTVFFIQNVGNNKLVILDVVASCGCTIVDYEKRSILPDDSLYFKIAYNAEKKGYFNKTINVYCNVATSPIQFHIKGTAGR